MTEIDRLRALVAPIASDLQLDVYDIERRGGTLRVTLDTPASVDGGITLDSLSLATRLISRELDHDDPIAGSYTLEVTSPGIERPLRTAAHFQREIGKAVTVRLRDAAADPRRVHGTLVGADDDTITVACDDHVERTMRIDGIDKARLVVDWTPKPKPGKAPAAKQKRLHAPTQTDTKETAMKEHRGS